MSSTSSSGFPVCCVICRNNLGSSEGTGAGGGEAGALESDFCSASAAGGSVCAGALWSGFGDMIIVECSDCLCRLQYLDKLLARMDNDIEDSKRSAIMLRAAKAVAKEVA